MKKHTLAALLVTLAVVSGGCSNAVKVDTTEAATTAAATEAATTEAATEAETESSDLITRGEYNPLDYVTITEYKNLEFSKADLEPSEEDIQAEIDDFLSDNEEDVEVTDRAVQDGDTVNIDYVGYMDGEAFDGGTAEGQSLTIGSGSYIDGFESGLVGHNIGETVTLDLTFPDPYTANTDYSGKACTFEVTINSITVSQTPEYTDELVAAQTDYSTTDEYTAYLKEELYESNRNAALAEKLMANATFADSFPESLTNYYYEYYYSNLVNYYGSDVILSYMDQNGMTENELVDTVIGSDYLESSEKSDLILDAIAEQEGITAEGEDYEQLLNESTTNYSFESTDAFLAAYGEENFQHDYVNNQAYDLVYDSMVIK